MKKGVLVLGIVAWVIIIVFIALFVVFRTNVASFVTSNFFTSSALVKEESFSVQDIDSLVIQSDSKSIEILAVDAEKATVYQYGRQNTPSEELFSVSESNGILTIDSKRDFRFFRFWIGQEKIIVELPASWTGDTTVDSSSGGITVKDSFKWNDVNIKVSSGGIDILQGLDADNLDINVSSGGFRSDGRISVKGEMNVYSSSGGVRFNKPVEAGLIKVNSTSGAITFNNAASSDLTIINTSGGITLGEIKTNAFSMTNASGGISVEGITGSGNIKSTSGGIRIKLLDPLGNVNLSSTSGSINISVDESLSFRFSGEATSGGISANFPLIKDSGRNKATAEIGSDPAASITATTNSGGISINQ